MRYPAQISSLMDFGTPDCSLGKGTERLSEICGVAVVTAGGVCSDTRWWLKRPSCGPGGERDTRAEVCAGQEYENNQLTALSS